MTKIWGTWFAFVRGEGARDLGLEWELLGARFHYNYTMPDGVALSLRLPRAQPSLVEKMLGGSRSFIIGFVLIDPGGWRAVGTAVSPMRGCFLDSAKYMAGAVVAEFHYSMIGQNQLVFHPLLDLLGSWDAVASELTDTRGLSRLPGTP